jgi:hypothetical protein
MFASKNTAMEDVAENPLLKTLTRILSVQKSGKKSPRASRNFVDCFFFFSKNFWDGIFSGKSPGRPERLELPWDMTCWWNAVGLLTLTDQGTKSEIVMASALGIAA